MDPAGFPRATCARALIRGWFRPIHPGKSVFTPLVLLSLINLRGRMGVTCP